MELYVYAVPLTGEYGSSGTLVIACGNKRDLLRIVPAWLEEKGYTADLGWEYDQVETLRNVKANHGKPGVLFEHHSVI